MIGNRRLYTKSDLVSLLQIDQGLLDGARRAPLAADDHPLCRQVDDADLFRRHLVQRS